ncbi:MAG: prenyltransferase/squalene oxidase repeat-containing protein [Planctomycetaceae bacterium]
MPGKVSRLAPCLPTAAAFRGFAILLVPEQKLGDSDVETACQSAVELLLSQRNSDGWWTGELSTSALSTATAVMALHLAAKTRPGDEAAVRYRQLVDGGLAWLAEHQNSDGGWGDTVLSLSNISTTMLANAVFHAAGATAAFPETVSRSQSYVQQQGGAEAVLKRYGRDRTFSVPILTHCALAGTVDWQHVIPLPFELACVPARWYAAVRMPVVSYALPALIAIGHVIFRKRRHRNPLTWLIRTLSINRTLKVLESIQPSNGGFLEATPLTSFVCMSLLGCGRLDHPVTVKCLSFIESSVRADGSWPIDTNLATWVTTLSVNAMSGNPLLRGGLTPEPSTTDVDATGLDGSDLNATERGIIRRWLLNQQYQTIHPYTNSPAGGWSWTDLPGGVPDGDDTPSAMLALMNLRDPSEQFTDRELAALESSVGWLLRLQNRNGGWPTFCPGWGTLPFDRSSCDLTAHAIRALHAWQSRVPDIPSAMNRDAGLAIDRGLRFLEQQQAANGSWLPLWFGNQHNVRDENPLYGTAKVLLALKDIGREQSPTARKAVAWLVENQNDDGGWSGRRGLQSSTEETALAVEVLTGIDGTGDTVRPGVEWLVNRIADGTAGRPAPIGFYFAKLWYFEKLYPIIFTVAALKRWLQEHGGSEADCPLKSSNQTSRH